MSRDAFLARVRQAAAAGRAYRVHLEPESAYAAKSAPVPDDVCAQMAAAVEEVGGLAARAADLGEAAEIITGLLDKYSPKSALCWRHELLNSLRLTEILERRGIAVQTHEQLAALDEPRRRAAIMAADIGLTSADAAIADTGSLVMCSGPGHERVASLTPPVHIAIVERAQIAPNLTEAFARLFGQSHDLPSNATIITGPSKTGDIELTLTTGVHGPGQWHVVIIG
ncbi:MAG: lactate utilization protein [Planctomycetales bacterium]|nr:lactate utilization protein [Planctomycetales bacterium]